MVEGAAGRSWEWCWPPDRKWSSRKKGAGHLFVFRSKRGDRLKLLYWNEGGYAIWYQRLEEGPLRFPAASAEHHSVEIRAADLALLLDGVDLDSVRRRKRYRHLLAATAF